MTGTKLSLGFIINPMAGIGGPAALKGSDGVDTYELARAKGYQSKVADRASTALLPLADLSDSLHFYTAPGIMGAAVLEPLGFSFSVIGSLPSDDTSAEDTRRLIGELAEQQPDLLLFAGGDGTARDVFDAAPAELVVLGIPAGVKMHSGVFANRPEAVAHIVRQIVAGSLTSVIKAEVRDIDEAAFRQGIVRAAFYGEMTVPAEVAYIQQTKVGGKESEPLVLTEIAADIVEQMDSDRFYFMGSGSTTAAIMESMGLPNTLLGVDVVKGGDLVHADADEQLLYQLASENPAALVVTVIGGQGHVFGRGNQQFSARVIRAVGLANVKIVATKAKLEQLDGRPLVADTGDADLDKALGGLVQIVTGYEDAVFYRMGAA